MLNSRRQFNDQDADKVWVDQFGNVDVAQDITGTTVYRNQHSENGWNVDHIKPISQGGTNNMSNLQVLHSEENKIKADNFPHWKDTKGKQHTQYERKS